MYRFGLDEQRLALGTNGRPAIRVFEHSVAPAFRPQIIRSVWHVIGSAGKSAENSYIALRITVESLPGSLNLSIRQETAPLGKQKVQRFVQKLAKVRLDGLAEHSGPSIDGTSYRIALGDVGGVSIRWWNKAPTGYGDLVALVNEYLEQVDAAFAVAK